MLPFKLAFHPKYDLNLGSHVFPSQKFRLIHELLLREKFAAPEDFVQPQPASDEDVLRVHKREYIEDLKAGTLSASQLMLLEIPWSSEMVDACWLAAGGSILAAECALRDGFAANIGGGFHHAFPSHGEGFCAIHDVAIAIRRLQADKAIRTAIIVDTDVHHGNGTAAIFHGDESVFTMSIHQENNYPMSKPPSDMDIHLPDGIEDADYLAILEAHLHKALGQFTPDLMFYVGGADPYRDDQLGGLRLTKEGLRKRDALVFSHGRKRHIPVAITLAGGYARRLADTIEIHVGTILAARDLAVKHSSQAAR